MAKWYKDTLEIKIKFGTPNLSWQEFKISSKDITTHFSLDHPGDNPSIVEQQKIVISFRVDDIHQVVHKLELKGIEFYGKPTVADVGQSYFATIRDPEGNWLQFSQRKTES